ncbi:hypothetical protein BOX15_Mlig012677g1 [Macrostomum lignano]|uniref:THAP-type domain-containing protein n=1 Tax=Macrostomum lignano TaxID=282301 RepID=A0A267GTA3_9PLAT|nr:hypothetical protein BOX15_Mlig012677g1 [Macrostomum lignano]
MLSARRCCASGCTSSLTSLPEAGQPIRLHCFPSNDKVAQHWQQILELATIRKEKLRVCSLHFLSSAYNCPALRHSAGARLRWDALPDLELTMPRLSRYDLKPVVARSDEEADNTYPPQLERWDKDLVAVAMPHLSLSPPSTQSRNQCVAESAITAGHSKTLVQLRKTRQCVSRQRATIKRLQQQICKAKAIKFGSTTMRRMASNSRKLHFIAARGMRWSKDDLTAAIRLHHKSPAAYRMLRKDWQLPLPSESALKRRTCQFFKSPGVCSTTLMLLKQKLATGPEHQRIATLCFDGMSLSPSVRYDQHKDEVIGFDTSSSTENAQRVLKPITEAIVAVLRGVSANWKQAIAYYPVNRTLGQSGFAAAIENCLHASHDIGIRVIALVADQETTQWALLSRMVSPSAPFFRHPVSLKPVYVIVDIPHCLKNLRNALMKNDVAFDGHKLAKWQHVVDFFEADRSRSLRLASQLTDAHIALPLGQKMRVSIAAQVLSHSVASGMQTLVHHQEIEPSALQTAEFLQRVNDLFDMLNSAIVHDKGFKRPIFRESLAAQTNELRKAEAFLQSLRFLPKSGKPEKSTMKFKEAWRLSAASIRELSTALIDEESFDFVCTRSLTQDHVENLFSIIRGRNGFNEKPELAAFVGALRSVAASGLDRPDSAARNCEDDGCTAAVTANLSPATADTSCTSPSDFPTTNIAQQASQPSQPDPILAEATEYVGGFVLKTSRVLECCACKQVLTAAEPSGAHLKNKLFSHAVNGLTQPSAAALQAFSRLEASFLEKN